MDVILAAAQSDLRTLWSAADPGWTVCVHAHEAIDAALTSPARTPHQLGELWGRVIITLQAMQRAAHPQLAAHLAAIEDEVDALGTDVYGVVAKRG